MKRAGVSAPFAITSLGEVLVNVDAFSDMQNPGNLLELVRREGGTVFVGVPISDVELREVARRVDDALAEAAARLVAKRQRRRRGKVRKKARSAS